MVIPSALPVAVRSFRLWKLKDYDALCRRAFGQSCSSFVPIVETESFFSNRACSFRRTVAVRSFRLWKLKVRASVREIAELASCSSFVPIVETERR